MQKSIAFAFAIGAFASGIAAAFYWVRSTLTDITPAWVEPADDESLQSSISGLWANAIGLYLGVRNASRLNRIAALWTAVSVFMAGVATAVGSWPF